MPLLLLLLVFFGTPAEAARICVPSSFDGSCNSSQATIAAAITAATTGVDNIYVQGGTYSEKITISKNITILSASGSATTTIQGDGTNNPVVTFTSTAILDGFTIDNQHVGSSLTRGIIINTLGITPTIQNSTIQGNYAPNSTDGGGGIYIVDASATLASVTVRANTALNRSGCGIYIKSTATGTSSLNISNSTIGGAASGDGNLCTNGWGGGVYYTVASGGVGTLSISNSNIQYNQGNSGGGGLYVNNVTNGVTISNTSFQNNFTGTNGDGGGLYALSSQVGINGNVISNNNARSGSGIYAGAGGVVTLGSTTPVTLDNNDTNNNTSGDGGGIVVTGAGAQVTMTGGSITNSSGRYGAGLYVGASASASLTDVTLTSNACAGTCATGSSNGGAISMAGSSLTVTRGRIRGNSALNGGGIYASAGTSTFYNSDITGNVASTDGGGAMVSGATTLNIYNSTVAGNYAGAATTGNGGGGIRNNAATLNITNGIIYGNTGNTTDTTKYGISSSGTTSINFSSYQSMFGACTSCANNRAVGENPLFVNLQQAGAGAPTTAGNFHLQATSPVINQGTNNGFTPDIDGDSRPQSSGYEMGSDEVVATGTNNTTAGTATAVNAGAFYISVSMPYTDDANANNTYTVDYKLSSEPTVWTNWVTAAAHVASPYTTTINGLTQGASYDIRVTYNDADGVSGTNPQTITGIVTAPIVRAVPGTYATIQAAINASNNGDTVQVANGTYSENINFNGKLVTVISQNGAALTTIQGTGANSPVVTFGSGETSSAVLDGFTIDNQAAAGTNSSGIKITASSAPTLKNLILEGNGVQAGYYGGGVYINGATATIQNSTLGTVTKPNTAGAGGGALYATALSAPLSVSNSTIAYNSALNGGAVHLAANGAQTSTFTTVTFSNNSSTNHGGAIYNDSSKLTVNSSSAFNTNVTGANMSGGAIVITGATASASISNTTFTSNSSNSYGGAIYLTGSTEASPLTISNATFTNNGSGAVNTVYGGAIGLDTVTNATVISSTTLTGSSATNRGGGIYANAAPLTMTSVNVTSNSSNLEGGGMYLIGAATVVNMTGGSIASNTGTRGGGVYISGSTFNTTSGTTISSNYANSTIGGGIDISSASTVTLTKTTISGNRANQRGGGIAMALTGGTVTLTNSNVTGNSADMQAYSNGGGIYDLGGTVILMNTTVAGNYATQSAAGFAAAGADDVITNSIFWGNTAGATPEISGTPTVTYSDVSGGFAGTGNINNDPLFVTLAQASSGNPTTAGNFHLQSTSPAKNVGTATGAPSDDIDGDSRSSVDMGSDEYISGANTAPVGGYTADNVIPTAQVTQATDGSGLVTINWKGRDDQANNVMIKTFQYSVDGGTIWNAPTNGDASASLSANWNNNGGAGWTTATTLAAATVHSFTFNTKHADVTGVNGVDQSDVQVRFLLNDGTVDSAASATSQSFPVDDLNPTATITSATYGAATDTMVITGTNFTTIATASTDIKNYVDWTKFVWDINGDNATTANITFVVGDVTSLTVTDATTLTLVFTAAKGTAIEATAGYGSAGGADTIDVTAGFSKDYFGNAATTDAVTNAPLGSTISGTVYTDEGVTTIANGTTIRLLVNGVSAGTATTTSGVYSITTLLSAGDALLAYIDSNGGTVGNTVTVSNGANLTGLNIYANRVITRHDNSGSLTNALMSTALGAYSDTDILYSVSAGNLTVSGTGVELHVWATHSFIPGGTITAPNMHIAGTLNSAANAINVAGNWDATGGVFTSSGTVTFNATSGTNTIIPGGVDANHDFQNIVFNDAAGTATFQLGGAIKANGTFTVTNGIVNTTASNYAVTVGGDFSQAAGSQFMANGSTLTMSGNVTADGSADGAVPNTTVSANYNSAILVMNGSGKTLTFNNLTGNANNGFYDLTVGQAAYTTTLASTLAVRRLLTIGSGTLTSAGGVQLYLRSIDGNADVLSFDPASNLSIDQLNFYSNTPQNIPSLTNWYNCNIMLAANGTVTQTGNVYIQSGKSLYVTGNGQTDRSPSYVTSGFNLYVTGSIIVGNAGDTAFKTLNGANSSITTNANFTIKPGSTFTATGSTVTLSSNATTQVITSSGNAFNNLYLNAATGGTVGIADALTVNGTFTLNDGTFNFSNPTYDYQVTTSGDVTINANATTNAFNRTSKWLFNGTSILTDNKVGTKAQLWIVELNGTSLTLASSSKMKNLTITAGTLNLGNGGYTLEVNGTGTPVSKTGGIFSAGNSTFLYSGITTATNIATLPYNNLQLTPTAATSYSLTGHLTGADALTGNLTIAANATLTTTASNYNISLAGNWSNSGAFTANSGTVTLNGTNQSISGNTTFNNLTKSVASATTLTFAASSTTTVNGTATLSGASGQLLTLASSSPGTTWNFNLTASANKAISYVSVSWSNASGSHAGKKPISPTNSTDGGNNIDWFATSSPVITVTKLSTVISDPFSTTNPKRVPGAVIEYSIVPSNTGSASPDVNSTYVTDIVDATSVSFFVTGSVSFTDGATSSTLAIGTVSYSSTAAPGPYVYTYTPVPDGNGYDGNITSIKIQTTGTFAFGGSPAPSFTLKYQVKVK